MSTLNIPRLTTFCHQNEGCAMFVPTGTVSASQYSFAGDAMLMLSANGDLSSMLVSPEDGLLADGNDMAQSIMAVVGERCVPDAKIVEIASNDKKIRIRMSTGHYLEFDIVARSPLFVSEDTEVLRITANGKYKASNDFYMGPDRLYPLMENNVAAVYETPGGDVLLTIESDENGQYKMKLDETEVDRAPLDVITSGGDKWAIFSDSSGLGYAKVSGGITGYDTQYYCNGWGYVRLCQINPNGFYQAYRENFTQNSWPAAAQGNRLSNDSDSVEGWIWLGIGWTGHVMNVPSCGSGLRFRAQYSEIPARTGHSFTPFIVSDNDIVLLDSGVTLEKSALSGASLIDAIYGGQFANKVALPLGTPKGSSGDGRFCYNSDPWADATFQ